MTEPQAQDYSNEEDLPPDSVVELSSLEEDDPIVLEEGADDPSTWPMPPETWQIDAHEDEYKDDPDTVLGQDDTPDSPDPLTEQETPV